MNKIIGYILSILGLTTLTISSEKGKALVPIAVLQNFQTKYLLIIGGALVVAGIVLIIKFSDASSKKQAEVPIYEGKGKHRKVVAYQRE